METFKMIEIACFVLALGTAVFFFQKNAGRIRRNIQLGRDVDRSDRSSERWKIMGRVALGQSKMVARPVAGFFHIIIYAGFLLINIEVLEIFIDGLLGTHRIFSGPLGGLYTAAIDFFELLSVGVILACLVFLWRRNVQRIKRFHTAEMRGWPTKDAQLILYVELVLMGALLMMNAAESKMEETIAGPFVISQHLGFIFNGWTQHALHLAERGFWWLHLIGILAFLNYLPFSKHFHIILSFPNVWYSKLDPKGSMGNMPSVKEEVEKMMDPNADPFAAPAEGTAEPERFGAKDVFDLHRVQLMNAYTCTECGRCTSVCPAHETGKKLSPRKIMMDVRDRLDEVGKNIDKNGEFQDDGLSLLDDRISREELWACTSCNACVDACPVAIDPLSIILDMRRYLVMEESAAPQELNLMMTNVENNGAPWQFAQADRLNWAQD